LLVGAALTNGHRPVIGGAMTDSVDGPETVPEIVVDARGHRCPVPTLKLRRALEAAPAGARLRLLADDPLAKIDVPHFLSQTTAALVGQTESAGVWAFSIAK
jgi:tRNA 2-thiouridine synthesizing protein A